MSEADPLGSSTVLPFVPPVEDLSRPYRHRYGVLTIRLTIVLVIDLHVSYCAVAAILALFSDWVGCGSPCLATVRQWLLRLGLFLLRRAVPVVPGGWILIADHTVQIGPHKCLVVLGLPARALRQTGFTLSRSDVRVLSVKIMEDPTGEKILPILQEVQTRVGSVAQIVTDNGSDLINAVHRLQKEQPAIIWTYDVRHMLACLLKARLAHCERFGAFIGHCGQTLPKLRQTSGNFLAPPALRVKARYMNLDTHMAWASRLLLWEQKGDWSSLSQSLGKTSEEEARVWFNEKLGWLREFRSEVEQWQGMLEAADLALSEVQQNGMSRQTAGRFWCQWRSGSGTPWFSVAQFAQAVREGLEKEGEKLSQGERLLGSSDVIESLFGKYKEQSKKSPQKELGASVLLLPLMTESLSNEEIKEGLETVSGKQVREWLEQELGESAQARKRRLFGEADKSRPATPDGPQAA